MIEIDKRLSLKLSAASFVCMCMIVGIHVPCRFVTGTCLWYVVTIVKTLFHVAVPLFFVISGFLLAGHFGENQWWGREVRKRFGSLLIPYVIWNFVYFAISFVPHSADLGFKSRETWGWGGAILGLDPFDWPALPYLWYVRCLLGYVVCAPIFLGCCRRRIGLLVIAFEWLAYAVVLMLCKNEWNEINWIHGAFFFSVGIYLRWNGTWVIRVIQKIPTWLLWLVGVVILFVNMTYISVFGVVNEIGMFSIAVALWKTISDLECPKWLTRSAFPIFVLHGGVLVGLRLLFIWCGLQHIVDQSMMALFMQIVCVVAVCVLVAQIIRRLSPTLASLLFGGR